MKLYMHPVSAAARSVRLLIAENNIACEEVLVDLMTGAHHQQPYASLNPSQMVPMLDDDGFRLTESSAGWLRLRRLSQHPALAGQHETAAELAFGQ